MMSKKGMMEMRMQFIWMRKVRARMKIPNIQMKRIMRSQ
jgi:hypothetical protein